MECKNCHKEIAEDSKYCEFCGQEVLKEKKAFKISEKIRSLVSSIMGIIIASFGIILPFAGVTSGLFNSYRNYSNVVSYFANNWNIFSNFKGLTYDAHIKGLIIGYVFIILIMALSVAILALSIIKVVKGGHDKLFDNLNFINFFLVTIALCVFGVNGSFTVTLLIMYSLYYIVLMIFKIINYEEKISLKVLLGIGFLFFLISFWTICGIGSNTFDTYIDKANMAYDSYFYASCFYITTLCLYGVCLVLSLINFNLIYNDKKLPSSIISFVLVFICIMLTVTSNINETNTINNLYVTPIALFIVTSVFLLVVSLLSSKNKDIKE